MAPHLALQSDARREEDRSDGNQSDAFFGRARIARETPRSEVAATSSYSSTDLPLGLQHVSMLSLSTLHPLSRSCYFSTNGFLPSAAAFTNRLLSTSPTSAIASSLFPRSLDSYLLQHYSHLLRASRLNQQVPQYRWTSSPEQVHNSTLWNRFPLSTSGRGIIHSDANSSYRNSQSSLEEPQAQCRSYLHHHLGTAARTNQEDAVGVGRHDRCNETPPINLVSSGPISSISASLPNRPSNTLKPPVETRIPNKKIAMRNIILACPEDRGMLNENLIFLRKQIEFFQATTDEIMSHTRGRNKGIAPQQVGVRCYHCRHIPLWQRRKGSTYFPSTLMGIYQAAQNINVEHLQSGLCPEMPREVQRILLATRATKTASSGAGKAYWAEAARMKGLVDTDDGIRFAFAADDGVVNYKTLHPTSNNSRML